MCEDIGSRIKNANLQLLLDYSRELDSMNLIQCKEGFRWENASINQNLTLKCDRNISGWTIDGETIDHFSAKCEGFFDVSKLNIDFYTFFKQV